MKNNRKNVTKSNRMDYKTYEEHWNELPRGLREEIKKAIRTRAKGKEKNFKGKRLNS